jgi:hypothetical protein
VDHAAHPVAQRCSMASRRLKITRSAAFSSSCSPYYLPASEDTRLCPRSVQWLLMRASAFPSDPADILPG